MDASWPEVHVPARLIVRAAQLFDDRGCSGHSVPRATNHTRAVRGNVASARQRGRGSTAAWENPLGQARPAVSRPRARLCCPLPAAQARRPGLSAPWQPGLTPRQQLPLRDVKEPADRRARWPSILGFPIADQVLEERRAGEQARRHKLQQQAQQESGSQGEPHSA